MLLLRIRNGFGEEALEPNERDQSLETRPQHLRRRKRRSPHPRRQGPPLLAMD
ncbi:unnamed protein product [Camellia sinensis]